MIDRSQTRDTPRDPVAIETAVLFGTRVAETILAAVICDRIKGRTYDRKRSRSDRHQLRVRACHRGAVHIWVPFPRYAALRSPGMTAFIIGDLSCQMAHRTAAWQH